MVMLRWMETYHRQAQRLPPNEERFLRNSRFGCVAPVADLAAAGWRVVPEIPTLYQMEVAEAEAFYGAGAAEIYTAMVKATYGVLA